MVECCHFIVWHAWLHNMHRWYDPHTIASSHIHINSLSRTWSCNHIHALINLFFLYHAQTMFWYYGLPFFSLFLSWTGEALGALAVFNNDASAAAVLSPASHFATTIALHDGKTLAFGVHGTVTSCPAGFSSSAVVAVDAGINKAMRTWGNFLLNRSGKPRGRWQSDFSLSHLGYTTDNGCVRCMNVF